MTRRWTWILSLGAIAAVAWGATEVVAGLRFDSALADARKLMSADQFVEARGKLIQIPTRWSSDPEVNFRLGVCEHAAGNITQAVKVWARVPLSSQWGPQAGLARARTLVGDLGRFTDGERVLTDLLREPGPHREETRHTLAELYFWEGRRDEMRQLVIDNFKSASEPAVELQTHWKIDNAVILVERIGAEVEHAAKLSADDDRVWLAEATA
jgi:enediyne biosynthesis protein E4